MAEQEQTALGDIRVLDLTDEMGQYCTKLLADLGADVIKIERPRGDPTRNIGPFFHDSPHPEKSLFFFNFNTNKRSVTLNLESRDGQRLLKRLVETADVLVETFSPGYLEGLGLGYDVLKQINPRLIMTSITGFGQTGPYKHYKAPDIVGVAMGGLMYIGGFPEDAPNYPGAFQGYHLVSVDAAIATQIALYHRDLTNEGQKVDVSMQESVASASELPMVTYDLRKVIVRRRGREIYRGWNEVFQCQDGYVLCGPLGGGGWRRMLQWMDSEGMAADLKSERMQQALARMADRQMDRPDIGGPDARHDPRELRQFAEEIAHIEEVWAAWLVTHTRDELYEGCQNRGVAAAPVNSAKEVVDDPQLNARSWFVDVAHPELNATIKYPGAPYRLSKTGWRIARRAPLIGEHNGDIYENELGLSRNEIAMLKQAEVI